MQTEIRRIQPKDLDSVLRINQDVFLQPWLKKDFDKYARETFIVKIKGDIAGFVVGKTTDKTAMIRLIATDKNFRKQGIGQKLTEHILNHFKKNGAKTVFTHTRTSNKNAVCFLKNSGFNIAKTVKNYYTDGESAYLLKKELS